MVCNGDRKRKKQKQGSSKLKFSISHSAPSPDYECRVALQEKVSESSISLGNSCLQSSLPSFPRLQGCLWSLGAFS